MHYQPALYKMYHGHILGRAVKINVLMDGTKHVPYELIQAVIMDHVFVLIRGKEVSTYLYYPHAPHRYSLQADTEGIQM